MLFLTATLLGIYAISQTSLRKNLTAHRASGALITRVLKRDHGAAPEMACFLAAPRSDNNDRTFLKDYRTTCGAPSPELKASKVCGPESIYTIAVLVLYGLWPQSDVAVVPWSCGLRSVLLICELQPQVASKSFLPKNPSMYINMIPTLGPQACNSII